MFSPEMMQAAQSMMSNMKPEELQRMTQMAANMDPSVMEGMMKNMGGGGLPPNVDTKQALNEMKNMTPEQLKASMSQAQNQMGAQKQYYYNAAEVLKNEGNAEVKKENYAAALNKYTRAIDNLKPHVGADVAALKVNLLNNAALCYLKTNEHEKALEACEDALKLDSQSFKALFRRGQAREAKGSLREAFADIRQAAALAPGDKAIGRELDRLRGELKDRGIDESSIPQPTLSASKSSTAGSSGNDQWAKAAERIAENPDMMKQATEAMSKMSPEDLQRMMNNAPLPPGMDAETMKKQMEHLQKNPEMMQNAMETLKSLPEEERRKMLAARADPRAALSNPEMLRQAAEMAKNMSPDDLKRMGLNSPEDADMMRQAAEAMGSNPQLAQQMSDMMKNMPPEQLQEMMNLSAKMKAGGGGGMDPSAMLNNPDMLKAAEAMMKSLTPKDLAAMAQAQGMNLSEADAAKMTRFMPWVMRLLSCASACKKAWSALWSKKGRMVIAVLVVLIAMYQHYRS